MKREAKTGLLLCWTVLLAGCVTPRTTQPPAQGVDLKQYKQLQVVFTDAVKSDYSKKGLPMFQGLLRGRLESMGCTLVESNAQMVLTVNVHEFDPGSRTARMLVGFGAGEAILKYTAAFRDEQGGLLAQLEGGKTYSGMEVTDNANLKSNESTRMASYLFRQPDSRIQ